MTRDKGTCPVRWMGRQVIVTLPEQIDVSNVGQIREELLSIINRGAAGLIADMTATLSCDHAGADALARAHQRAVISGTQLRLVVTERIVQRVLTLNGLDRLIPIYPCLEAAVAAHIGRRETQVEPRIWAVTLPVPQAADLPQAADQADRTGELLDWVVTNIFDTGVILQTATDLPRDAGARVTEALRHLDEVVREIRRHVFAERDAQFGFARKPRLDMQERLAQTANRAASLQEQLVQTAHALQLTAADTATMLEQRANLVMQPGQIDYPTEIKRWRAFADQAEQMAKNWEQQQ